MKSIKKNLGKFHMEEQRQHRIVKKTSFADILLSHKGQSDDEPLQERSSVRYLNTLIVGERKGHSQKLVGRIDEGSSNNFKNPDISFIK